MMDLAHFLDSLAAENETETVTMMMRQPGSVTGLAASIVVAVAAAAAVAAVVAAAGMYLHRTYPIVPMLIWLVPADSPMHINYLESKKLTHTHTY